MNIAEEIKYPRGIDSWIQTFYQMSLIVFLQTQDAYGVIENSSEDELTDGMLELTQTHDSSGLEGLRALTERWTTEFETIHKDTDWHDDEHDFWLIVDEFVNNKLKPYE